ncbi:MAG: hypothetical protein WCF14_04545, partial [Nitrososphaeraceae archaeon]
LFTVLSLSYLVGTVYSSSNFTVYSIQEKPFGVPYQNWVIRRKFIIIKLDYLILEKILLTITAQTYFMIK